MGCKGLCNSWPKVKIGSRGEWYNGGVRYCTVCDVKVDPRGVPERVEGTDSFVFVPHRQTKTVAGHAPRPNRCPCCHNLLRTTPVESKDLDSRPNKVYGEVPRIEVEDAA